MPISLRFSQDFLRRELEYSVIVTFIQMPSNSKNYIHDISRALPAHNLLLPSKAKLENQKEISLNRDFSLPGLKVQLKIIVY